MNQGASTVRFMVIVSVAFIAVLATVNELTKSQIERNFRIEQAKKMLYAFNIFPEGAQPEEFSPTATTADIPWKEGQVLETLDDEIQTVTLSIPESMRDSLQGTFLEGMDSIEIYERVNENDEVVAYGLPLYGKGLWGTIEGFGVIGADLQKMQGIAFTQQVETPGLGARITEEEFKSYFRNLDLSGFHQEETAQPPIIMVKDKAQTNQENSTNSIQAITGATQTSQGVLNMVNSNVALYIDIIQASKNQA
ncbi:FMN-binding protein [candidate division KSB3 bacterium]|uniref:FMN-binding protein n=1 Tax=candidate division KSB3 bacterium TaxID=2044937 RepID=A0A9D5JZ22_9BACT|nr:FMN-binding protein [candidate division KSB3 bacterium]MBD3326601.1 FMN-binding protein [candidate division KSB3 bacterium]